MTTACPSSPCNGLFHGLDGLPPYCLDRLLTLGRKVVPCLGLVKCFRLIQALPLGDGNTLRGRALHCNDLPAPSTEIPSARSLLRSRDNRDERRVGRGIDRLELADSVGFRLDLSVQPLHGGCAERDAGQGSKGQGKFSGH